jgi:hypothetical protein
MLPLTSVLSVGMFVALSIGGCDGSGEGSTTVPTTTTAPTTTLDPIAAEEAAVSEAAVQARLLRSQALIHLDDPTALDALDQYYVADGPARAEIDDSLDVLRTEGWRARANPNIPEAVTVEHITFMDGAPPTRAELIVCIVDSGVIYEPGGAPDGGDSIVNDQVVAARTTYMMVKDSGSWKLHSLIGGEEFEGVIECPAEQ